MEVLIWVSLPLTSSQKSPLTPGGGGGSRGGREPTYLKPVREGGGWKKEASRQAGWWLGLVGGAMKGDPGVRSTPRPCLLRSPSPLPPFPGRRRGGSRELRSARGSFLSLVVVAQCVCLSLSLTETESLSAVLVQLKISGHV